MIASPPESASQPEKTAAQLTVRLAALAANYREVLARSGGAAVAPVVKADAYGLGLAPVARALYQAGADSFFVARLEEGIVLRNLLPLARIFVLDGVVPGTARALLNYALIPVLNAREEVSEWSDLAHSEKRELAAALHCDTGMNRSGLSEAELAALMATRAHALGQINLVLIMSHLACADDPSHAMNRLQLARFRAALALLPPARASLAASAGIELGPEYRFDAVRPGLALYGGNPIAGRASPYRTVAALTARVLQLRRVSEGESVGYAAGFVATRASLIATVATGYADGLIRAMGARGRAAIAGVRVPFAGRLSMDLLALDATDIPPAALARGTEVEFLGDTITLEQVAEAAGTITHEVLASLTPRVRRIYVDQ